MSQFDLSAASPRRRTWPGAVAASAALLGLLAAPLPVHAQINGWMDRMNPWGPTFNQHSATNIMTPHMNYTPLVTFPQAPPRQFIPSTNFPQAGYPGGNYPMMPLSGFSSYPSSPQNYGPSNQMPSQSQGPLFYPAPPDRTQRPTPPAPTTRTGPGGLQVTVHPPLQGRSYTLPGSNLPIRGFGVQTPFGYQNNFPYAPIQNNNGPALLGGYYYGNYTDTYCEGAGYVPSIYSVYSGLPQYIYNVGTGLTVVGDPYYPVYVTGYQPFSEPPAQVTYNQTNYQTNYQTNNQYNYYADGTKRQTEDANTARPAVAPDSYQAAFADIEQAWKTGDLSLMRRHIRDSDTRLSVYFKGKYSYSIASGDYVQITRDAFDRLRTVSFQFTSLRRAKNGDVTAYGKQVYRTAGGGDASGDTASKDDTVPFRTDGTTPDAGQPYDRAGDPAGGQEKTVYVSYILRRYDNGWDIIGIDTSPTDLVK